MAVTFKLLGKKKGVLSSGSDLYPVPTGKAAVVSTISLVNRHSASVTYNVYVVIGANTRRLSEYYPNLGKGCQAILDQVITLGAGNVIRVDASVSGVVDAIVCGVERDA